jgi:hypothetical protein
MHIILYLSVIAMTFLAGFFIVSQFGTYPAFHNIPTTNHKYYKKYIEGARNALFIPLVADIVFAIMILFPCFMGQIYLWVSLGLLAFGWVFNILVFLPALYKLREEGSKKHVRHVVWYNSVRCLVWSARVALISLVIFMNM